MGVATKLRWDVRLNPRKEMRVDKSLSLARESRVHHPIKTAEFVTMICSSMGNENLRLP